MKPIRTRTGQAILMSLEADAASARGGFACLFSTADEYESALIMERRAQGHYGRSHGVWPVVMFVGCMLMMVGAVLLLG
jgi:hypothetical protein